MTNAPGYSFVLWAIPRFHRSSAAISGGNPSEAQLPDRLAANTAAGATHAPISAAYIETQPETATCMPARP